MFSRLRAIGGWLFNTVVEPEEFEAFDENISNALDGKNGGTYSLLSVLNIGGVGLRTTVVPSHAQAVVSRQYKRQIIEYSATGTFNPTAYTPWAEWVTFIAFPAGGGGGYGGNGGVAGGGGGAAGCPLIYRCNLDDFYGILDITIGSPGQGGVQLTSTAATGGGDIVIAEPSSGFSLTAKGGGAGASTDTGTGGVGGNGYIAGGGGAGGSAVNGGDSGYLASSIANVKGSSGSGSTPGLGGKSPLGILSDMFHVEATGSYVYYPIPFYACHTSGVGGTAGGFAAGGGGGAPGFLVPTTFGNERVHTAQGQSGRGYGGGGGGGCSENFSLAAKNGRNGCPGICLAIVE
jgi:hypothetical protein